MTDAMLALIELPRRMRPEDAPWLPRLAARVLPMLTEPASPPPAPPPPMADQA